MNARPCDIAGGEFGAQLLHDERRPLSVKSTDWATTTWNVPSEKAPKIGRAAWTIGSCIGNLQCWTLADVSAMIVAQHLFTPRQVKEMRAKCNELLNDCLSTLPHGRFWKLLRDGTTLAKRILYSSRC